jgi:hypothetical protein
LSANLDQLKARIRALQARTTDRGCTEAEAAAAAYAVATLLRENGLSDADVLTARATVEMKVRAAVTDHLVKPVARLCRCRVFFSAGYKVRRATYVGREPYPEIAAWLHAVVMQAVERASRDFTKSDQWKRRRTARTRNQARAAYLAGFALRLQERLDALAQPDLSAIAADMKLADQAMAKEGPMGAAKLPKAPRTAGFERAVEAGMRDANGVTLGWGVNGPAARLTIKGPGA